MRVLDIGVVRCSGEVFYNAQCILTWILKSKEHIWESEIVFLKKFLVSHYETMSFPAPLGLGVQKFTMSEFP